MAVTSEQICFLRKNKADLSNAGVAATASSGSAYANRALNRNNRSSWVTSGSTDGDGTYFEVDLGDTRDVSEIRLLGHNFKSYTVKYWNGSAWTAFSPAISETTYASENSRYTVTSVATNKLRIDIASTQTANQDKYLYQFIATELIGQLSGWPEIRNMRVVKNRSGKATMSGKRSYVESVGGLQCELYVKELSLAADLTILEALFNATQSFLVEINGGSETQFQKTAAREGYRFEDIFLARVANDYEPVYPKGQYGRGLADVTLKLVEVID